MTSCSLVDSQDFGETCCLKVEQVFCLYVFRVGDFYFIFIVPCIVIFYGIANRCHNVQ